MPLTCIALLAEILMAPTAIDQSRPNSLFVLADDLGYRELGCFGQESSATFAVAQIDGK